MALINFYYATFIANVLAIIALGLIVLYLLFYNEEDEDIVEEIET